ncbi:hypothetical protein [Hyphobacterium marinum]|uniref:Uncharacterized protein n=1 Tax=Hyphobacterium marinum TaxID=3116574 RepID=A0ABU7LWE5_9PROT|nr:hypothetical protein [Hyphobacterium sp. Y6023]MEE2565607.1 hypothetical protein [Hyphobacterium sp. Y6023]
MLTAGMALIAALALQTAGQPVETAECRIIADGIIPGRMHIPTRLRVDCARDATDADRLQAAASAVIARVPLDLPRSASPVIVPSARFERAANGNWQPAPGQRVFQVFPPLPRRMAERGYTDYACRYAVWPDAAGRPGDVEIECGLPRRARHVAVREVREAVATVRFLPVEDAYCFERVLHVTPEGTTETNPEDRLLCPPGSP